jgi:hypothetical protein
MTVGRLCTICGCVLHSNHKCPQKILRDRDASLKSEGRPRPIDQGKGYGDRLRDSEMMTDDEGE